MLSVVLLKPCWHHYNPSYDTKFRHVCFALRSNKLSHKRLRRNFVPRLSLFSKVSYTPMTIIRWRRFTVERLAQTPVKYVFSERLRILVYEDLIAKVKHLRLSEYSALSPKVPRFTNQVRFRSDLSIFH